jgi:glycine dehydrogenase subunit 1
MERGDLQSAQADFVAATPLGAISIARIPPCEEFPVPMTYIPNTPAEQRAMLRALGAETIEDLLGAIPADVRLQGALDLPPALSEPALRRHEIALAGKNLNLDEAICFLGAGSYDRVVPSVVAHLAKRSEFLTAYTPYQPEVSQGMLQATYEFQTMVCQITGMAIANASLYDGSTATVEAALMAVGPGGRGEVLVSRAVDPQYRQTLATYAHARGFTLREIALESGATSARDLEAQLGPETKAVIIQQPNFFGIVEDMPALERLTHSTKALFVTAITEPASLGVLAPPGAYNADIVAAEGASLGNPIGYGGPALGLFATKADLMKRMPGRLVGETVDDRGQRGFVLTLQAREQQIRREKATSNICTNQALLAVFATVYLAALGKQGFKELGVQCVQRAHYAFDQVTAIAGVQPLFDKPFFDEFAVMLPKPVRKVNRALAKQGIIGGFAIARAYPELGANAALFCVTEARTRDDIDQLVSALKEVLR